MPRRRSPTSRRPLRPRQPAPVGAPIYALLGPTNTGKTHRAIERMLEHESGVLGLPLRLLAREVYDRVLPRVHRDELALITGEEKVVPRRARYFVCTVEAMPLDLEVDFLGVDEIQLATHPTRGHTFTDRLLYRRGRLETWFLGSDSVASIVRELVPTAIIQRHARLSVLHYTGPSSLGALQPQSAVVAFSAPAVYELAERVRRRRGGAAVVLGALSPRARNAQVALYQSGEVSFLVATDAIGMGLNLDIKHVAFAERSKFDGQVKRPLEVTELAQIAGRAGRFQTDGSFGTLNPEPGLPLPLVSALTSHQVPPERQLRWRSPSLDFSSLGALLESLAAPSPHLRLRRVVAEDHAALKLLAELPAVRAAAVGEERVRLLWQVAQIPDYRQILPEQHRALMQEIYAQLLSASGRLRPDWLAQQVRRLDDVRGDLDTLLARMAFIRTFTYVTHQGDWVADAARWQAETRAVEDRLSDALHQALVARFVDHGRTQLELTPAVLSRFRFEPRGATRLEAPASQRALQREPSEPHASHPSADRGHPFAALAGLRAKLTGGATRSSTQPSTLAERLLAAPLQALELRPDGTLSFEGQRVARLVAQTSIVSPAVVVSHDALLNTPLHRPLQRHLSALMKERIDGVFRGLWEAEPALEPPARGLLYQLTHELGVVEAPRSRGERSQLSSSGEQALVDLGVAFGARFAHLRALNGAAGLTLRLALLAARGADLPADFTPRPAHPAEPRISPNTYRRLGYPLLGPYAIRVDLHEQITARLHRARPTPKGDAALLQRLEQTLRLPAEPLLRLRRAHKPRRRSRRA